MWVHSQTEMIEGWTVMGQERQCLGTPSESWAPL